MSYVRQGDIMVHSVDLGQLASDSRLGSNINHYDSMGTAVTDSGEHYETLERLRNTSGCCSGQQSQRSETNTSQKTYTRYIRPCGNFQNVNANKDSVSKTTNDRVPVPLRTLKKRRGVRSRCRTRNAIFSFIAGIVIGFIIASVCWLTVDRLKESKIVCEFSEKANDEREEVNDDGTKTSTAVQRTQTTTSQGHATTQDELGKSTTFRLTSLLSKITETSRSTSTSTSTSASTKVPKLTSLNVSSTEMLATSPTSTGRTLPAAVSIVVSNATGKTPILSTDSIKTTSPTTSQTLSNAKSTVTVQTPTLSDKDKTTDPTSQTPSIWTFSTLLNNTDKMYNTSSRNITETSTYRPTSTTTANTFVQSTDPLTRLSMMTSTVSYTQSLQQTTVHPNVSNSSNEKNVSYNRSTSTPAFTTEAASSAVHSSTSGPSGGSSSTLESLPPPPPPTTTTTTTTTTPAMTTITASPPSTPSTTEDHVIIGRRSVQGGHVYVRWGSLSCPVQAELMYKGYAAGGHWQHQGGATNTICLPEVPTWGNYSDNRDADRNLIYGTEYGSTDASFLATTGKKLRYKDVPCSVCQATGRLSHVMIPGKTECFPGWTQEYRGYLMGSGYIQNHASELICVDSSPDHVTGSDAAKGGNFLYFAEVRTGSLPSPPYVNGRELACVVCTL